jgi:beta-glucosidase
MEIIHAVPDFLGYNIYNGHSVRAGANGPEYIVRYPGFPRTAMKWPITPRVLDWGVRFLHERYGLPGYITENGLSCNDRVYLDGKVHDLDRIDFLTRYLQNLCKAVKNGADIRGYFHWSLTDNFEWCDGYKERFGLIYVDYRSQQRIPKDSYKWYAEVIRSGEV